LETRQSTPVTVVNCEMTVTCSWMLWITTMLPPPPGCRHHADDDTHTHTVTVQCIMAAEWLAFIHISVSLTVSPSSHWYDC